MSIRHNAYININGIIYPPEDAKISVFDRGFLFGDSIYEVTHSQSNHLYFLDEHISRLFESAKIISLKMDKSKNEIISEIIKTIRISNYKNNYIRVIITRGEGPLNLDPTVELKNNMIIIVKEFIPPKRELYINGINLLVPSILRNSSKSTNPEAKTGNYLNNIMAINEAKKIGFDDALMINEAQEITEGSTFNIFFFKKNILYTPHSQSGLLRGITRAKIIEVCHQNNINLIETNIDKNFIKDIDEAIICSSTRGVMPVSTIKLDDQVFNYTKRNFYQKIDFLYKDILLNESFIF